MATLPKANYHREFERAQYYTGIRVMPPCEDRSRRLRVRIFWEERIATALFSVGLIWAVQMLTSRGHDLQPLWQAPGPVHLCLLALVIWAHSKWRRSVKIDC